MENILFIVLLLWNKHVLYQIFTGTIQKKNMITIMKYFLRLILINMFV